MMSTRLEPPPKAARELSYERSAPWYTRKRNFYLIIFLLLLNVVATTSISWGPLVVSEVKGALEARRQAKVAAAAEKQRLAAEAANQAARTEEFKKALAWAAPEGKVIYTEEPAEAARLLAGTRYSLIEVKN